MLGGWTCSFVGWECSLQQWSTNGAWHGADDERQTNRAPTKRILKHKREVFAVCSRIQLTMKLRLFIFFQCRSYRWDSLVRRPIEFQFLFGRPNERTRTPHQTVPTRWAETNSRSDEWVEKNQKNRIELRIGKLTRLSNGSIEWGEEEVERFHVVFISPHHRWRSLLLSIETIRR